jgi:hypothetical protein
MAGMVSQASIPTQPAARKIRLPERFLGSGRPAAGQALANGAATGWNGIGRVRPDARFGWVGRFAT